MDSNFASSLNSFFLRKELETSSHQRCSIMKGVLRNFAKFTGKHLCQNLIFNKVAGLRPATLLKKETLTQALSCDFAKFLRTTFLQNTSKQLLLWKDKL